MAVGVAYRVLEVRGAAEDAVQDAFLAVWQRAATYRPDRGSVRAWLMAIVRNAAVDRRRGRYAPSLTDAPLEEVIAARTGIPLGTVKGRMRLGLQRLRRLLTQPSSIGPSELTAGPPSATGDRDRTGPARRFPDRRRETCRPRGGTPLRLAVAG